MVPEKEVDIDELTLEASRDLLTRGFTDARVGELTTNWLQHPERRAAPIEELTDLLEEIRRVPRGAARIRKMNTLVRTLGKAENLALLLDVLRGSLGSTVSSEAAAATRSRGGRTHCIYGWAGQTLVLASGEDATSGTTSPAHNVDEFLGYPPAQWALTIHIWQPNPGAVGFQATKTIDAATVVEPPHSHPFDFVSYVSIGTLRQSIYRETAGVDEVHHEINARYAGTALNRVDGVWPPHHDRESAHLRALENRLLLSAGDSYFLSTNAVHDVEIDRTTASHKPAITLFLQSEATVKPNAYISSAMADFHQANPDIKEEGVALDEAQWSEKLSATAAYLRGDAPELLLDDVVRCTTDYGFMHR
ncbi:hypothetical protein [Streptomyces sp. NL15-2K]|uniref:hypothetical protein n=1 Tax=Streptomyces sp. NL15-2K TaxID=376149 RepID=UPI000F5672B7|nr:MULTISPECIES: hypothetical protein [Actinomycetes]WKX06044.1 hypothetical protein Q4V64_00445 [Kutzneria buriramensis]